MSVLRDFSVTMQRNHMGFGGIVTPKSGCISLTLGPCNSFTFGVVSVLLSRLQMHMHGKGRRTCKCVGKCFEVVGAMQLKFVPFCSS